MAPRVLSSWDEIAKHLDSYPPPSFATENEGDGVEVRNTAWMFRGQGDASWELEPTIEREALKGGLDPDALERKVTYEFKSRAHMHIDRTLIPADEFSWLALMRHYGIPTRLLDFSLSPYVALYFAVRERREDTNARVWAVRSESINEEFRRVILDARRFVGPARPDRYFPVGDPGSYSSESDLVRNHVEHMRDYVEEALAATGRFRWNLREGCAFMETPPSLNSRLSAQQGVFLVNCAEGLRMTESLDHMMADKAHWIQTFDIASACVPDVERRLFQMNIHEQTLFPDIEGLAGLIRQKMRLHWT